MASRFREAEETIKISMTSSTVIGIPRPSRCASGTPRRSRTEKERERCHEREEEGRREVDIGGSSPGRAKNEQAQQPKDTVISYRSGTNDATELEGGGSARKIRREKEDPARRARWPAPGGNGAAA